MRAAWPQFGQALAGLGRLYRLLRREQIEVLLTFTHYSNMLGPPVGWLARVPLRLASARSLLADRPTWFRRAHALLLASAAVHHLIAISRPVQALYVEPGWLPATKVTIIPNGVDLAHYRQMPAEENQLEIEIPASAFVILTVARLERQKGHHLLLASARVLCEANEQLHFVWLGDGPEMERLWGAVQAAGLAGRIHLIGASDAVPAWLARADLFVLPSLAEGMPNALLEALAAGVPAIASAVGGVLDVLAGREAGVLVPAGDAAALAEAIAYLVANPARRQQLGEAGRALVEQHFSEATMLAAYAGLIERWAAPDQGS